MNAQELLNTAIAKQSAINKEVEELRTFALLESKYGTKEKSSKLPKWARAHLFMYQRVLRFLYEDDELASHSWVKSIEYEFSKYIDYPLTESQIKRALIYLEKMGWAIRGISEDENSTPYWTVTNDRKILIEECMSW